MWRPGPIKEAEINAGCRLVCTQQLLTVSIHWKCAFLLDSNSPVLVDLLTAGHGGRIRDIKALSSVT